MGDGWGRLAALRVWRSPSDQPRWARPALLGIAAVAAFCYAWGNTALNLESFYGAAVRSMSLSWHNFFFASFDPWGTVSIDKLPGAFWLQALSLKIFGFHLWALVLPQVIEGTLTVLVLYRVVRRVAGPIAGMAAAGILAVSPVTVMLNRGNVSDTLLILLLVLAVDATTRALQSGHIRSLLLAGVWVGLAFQAKMLQAWLVIPALAVAYVLAAPTASLARRCGHVVAMGAVTLVVSLSWMTVVTVVPAHDRPYVDGSCNNSLFSQVFLYNGVDRASGHELDHPGCRAAPPPVVTVRTHQNLPGQSSVAVSGGPGKFITGAFGRLDAWFFFPSIVGAIVLFVWRRSKPRTDAIRATGLLWVIWLVLTWSFFNASSSINTYYLAALVPPMAALCGMGLEAARQRWEGSRAPITFGLTAALGALFGLTLVPSSAGLDAPIVATVALGALTALVALVVALRRTADPHVRRAALIVGSVALLIGPAWTAALAVAADLGPFNVPYQSAALTATLHRDAEQALASAPTWVKAANHYPPGVSILTTETSVAISLPTLFTGREFLPLGGFSGRVPAPTLAQFVSYVRVGWIGYVYVPIRPRSNNPELIWVASHCEERTGVKNQFTTHGVNYAFYFCGGT